MLPEHPTLFPPLMAKSGNSHLWLCDLLSEIYPLGADGDCGYFPIKAFEKRSSVESSWSSCLHFCHPSDFDTFPPKIRSLDQAFRLLWKDQNNRGEDDPPPERFRIHNGEEDPLGMRMKAHLQMSRKKFLISEISPKNNFTITSKDVLNPFFVTPNQVLN